MKSIMISSILGISILATGCGKKEETYTKDIKGNSNVQDIIEMCWKQEWEYNHKNRANCREDVLNILESSDKKFLDSLTRLKISDAHEILKKIRYENHNKEKVILVYNVVALIGIIVAGLMLTYFRYTWSEALKREYEKIVSLLKDKIASLEQAITDRDSRVNQLLYNLSNTSAAHGVKVTSLKKTIDEKDEIIREVTKNIESKSEEVFSLGEKLKGLTNISGFASEFVNDFNSIEAIMMRLRKRINDEKGQMLGNFIAYNQKDIELYIERVELLLQKFSNLAEDQAYLLGPTLTLYKQAKVQYQGMQYKNTVESLVKAIGILEYIEALYKEPENNEGPMNNDPSKLWDDFRKKHQIDPLWLTSDNILLDFFIILELDFTQEWSDVFMQILKTQYKKMSSRYHPDKNKDPGAIECFKIVQIAYKTLSEEVNFQKYLEVLISFKDIYHDQ